MKKLVRSTIFYSFLVLFIILTVFISLYATGYRWILKWPPTLTKTGMLVVESTPANALVILNNGEGENIFRQTIFKKAQEFYTPAKIKNLKQNNYELRLEADGYWPLVKQVGVKSGELLIFDKLTLFRKSEPLLIYETSIQAIEKINTNFLQLNASRQTFDINKEIIADTTITNNTSSQQIPAFIIKNKTLKTIIAIGNDNYLAASDFEIYRFDANHHQQILTRSATKINGIAYKNSGYLVYSTAQNIKMLELNDLKNITTLLDAKAINNIILSTDEKIVYFTAIINNQTGLFKLLIE